MSEKSLWFKVFLSYFLGLISIPLSFLVIGIIPAVLCCTLSYALYIDYRSRFLSLVGFILGGMGILHCLLIFIFTIYAGFMYGSEDPLHARWQGVQLASFSIKTPEGELLNFENFREQKVIVAYWASWCAPCVSKIPHLNSLNRNPKVTVLGISSEGMNTIKHARDKYSIQYTVGRLNQTADPLLEVTKLPTLFFVDSRGVIQDVKVGLLDYSELKRLALKSDHKDQIRKHPRELFNGVDLLQSFWSTVFGRLGLVH